MAAVNELSAGLFMIIRLINLPFDPRGTFLDCVVW